MKWFITGLILSLPIFSVPLFGQSDFVFTRVMEPADFGTTGFAVGNPGASAAEVTFTLYSRSGTPLGTANLEVPPNGQKARLASGLFPTALSGGWVQARSTTSGLVAFWLGGDFQQFGDGAAAALTSSDLIVPLITPDSELNIVNPSAGGLVVTIRLYNSEGREAALTAVRPVAAKGGFREVLSNLFPAATLAGATHARLTCTLPFAASIIARNYLARPAWSVINAVPANTSQRELFFPHFVSGSFSGANYLNVLGVTNLSTQAQDVTITFTPADGGEPLAAIRSLAGSGGLRETPQLLFGFGSEYRDGWVNVFGPLPLTGFVAYADATAAGATIVAPQTTLRREVFFAHFADLPPWMTGIALLNIDSTDAEIEVTALTQDGALIGSSRFTLGPFSKRARLLRELIPQTATRPPGQDGGVVRIRSNIPIFGMELFFTTDLKILSGIGSSPDDYQ